MRRVPVRLPAMFLLLAVLVTAAGCGVRQPVLPKPEPLKLTPGAQLTYDYLYYLDQRTRLMLLTQSDPKPGSEDYARAIETQGRAAAAIESVISTHPSAMLYGEQASLYFNRKQINTAKAILRKGLSFYPDDEVLLNLLVNAYLVEQDRDMASATLEEYILKHPDDLEARVRLVTILVEAEEFARALDQIEMIKQEDRTEPVLYLKARALSRIGNRAEAIKTIRSILKKNPDHYEALAELAFIHEVTARFAQAVDVYEKLLELGGPEPEIRQRLITLNLKLNRVDRALAAALEGPDTKPFLLAATGIFLNQEFPAQASAVLDRLGGLVPAPPEYYFYKAVIAYDAEEDPGKALDFLDEIQPGSEHHAQALTFRVQILMDLGRKEEGFAVLREARKAYPEDLRMDRMLAEYLILEEQYDEAADVLRGAMERHGDEPALLFQYGALLDVMGQRPEAIRIMERIVENDPQHADALNYIGYTLAEEGRELDRAQVLIENAMQQKPGNGAITDSLAWVLYKKGEFKEAWEQIQIAVDLHENDAVIWEHYGDIAAKLGRKKDAAKGYSNALKFQPKDPELIEQKLGKL